MGTLTLDRFRDREAPWLWEDDDGILEMSDNVMMAIYRLPDTPSRPIANDLYRGGLIDRGLRVTDRGLALQAAYRAGLRR